jgi:RimJ/RimL family protein N-acetyltransferase
LPEAQRIPGRLVDLRRLEPRRHGADLWRAIGSNASLWDSVPPGPFADEASFTTWQEERAARPDQALYAIMDRSGAAQGLFFLINIERAVGRIEVGLVYGAGLARKTEGTEAFFLLARHVFETLGYRRLEWRCNPENKASVRAAERYGFTREGVLRQNLWLKGRNWDTAVFSIIDGEWPARAARLVAWLAPENFDEAGRQRRAMSKIAPA